MYYSTCDVTLSLIILLLAILMFLWNLGTQVKWTPKSKSHCDSQSVTGVEHHLGLMTRYLLLCDSYGLVFVGRPLWVEDGSIFCICCWSLPAQSFSGPSPLVLATIFYCLRFEASLFFASYDSQGHGGGIRPRLHTGLKWTPIPEFSYILTARTTHRKHSPLPLHSADHIKHLSSTTEWRHCACVNVFTVPLPDNASQYQQKFGLQKKY
jgi:hypothetical protein